MRSFLKIIMLVFLVNFTSCSEEGEKQSSSKRVMGSSTGRVNEMVVVIDNGLWQGDVGREVRNIFQRDIVGLPQPEPLYRLINVPSNSFNKVFKAARNILIVRKVDGEKAKLTIDSDVYAMPQVVQVLEGNSDETLIKALKKFKDKLVENYHDQDLKSVQKRLNKIARKDIPKLSEHGISLIVPNTFLPVELADNFWWYRSEIKEGKHYPILNLMIYITPMKGELEMSGSEIIATRDSVAKRYISGPTEGTFMKTEDRPQFAPVMTNTIVAGNVAIETRGLWMVKGDFMGGPFLNYTIFDEKNNRVITAEGFVYAAGTKKRNYVFEMEAIIKSLELK
jgi:hypothetical protein